MTKFYVEKESLQSRGLSVDDLQAITYEDEDDEFKEKPSIIVVSCSELADVMAKQDVILSF